MTYALGLLAALCLSHGPSTGVTADTITAATPTPEQIIADLRQIEVRVRKLHFVRPDLLQFPIPYDVIA